MRLHLPHHRPNPGQVCQIGHRSRRRLPERTVIQLIRAHHQEKYPEEKVRNISHSPAQHRQALKQHRDRRRHCQRRQPENQNRPHQRKEVQRTALRQLNNHRRNRQYQHHHREHRKVADRLGQRIKPFAHRRSRQYLPDPRLPVSLNSVLHHVKPDQRQPHRRHQPHHRTNPRRVIHPAIIRQPQRHLP